MLPLASTAVAWAVVVPVVACWLTLKVLLGVPFRLDSLVRRPDWSGAVVVTAEVAMLVVVLVSVARPELPTRYSEGVEAAEKLTCSTPPGLTCRPYVALVSEVSVPPCWVFWTRVEKPAADSWLLI